MYITGVEKNLHDSTFALHLINQNQLHMEETHESGGNKKIYVAIIALLLLINGVALYLLYSENKAKKDLGDQKIALEHDFKNLSDINFKLEVDGDLKQQGNTSLMLFSFNYIISYLSKFFTLRTGDLIFTGTPKGVGPVSIGNKLTGYIENEKLLEFEVK